MQIHEKETTVEIKVIDTGEGIPQEALPYIFDRFYQVDTAVSSPGSGIGLALSKGVVALHHGKISVQSALQYGTIFTVTLPKDNLFQEDNYVTFTTQETSGYDYAVPYEENTGKENCMEKTEEESGTQENPTDKDCILVVEDNEELLQVLTSFIITAIPGIHRHERQRRTAKKRWKNVRNLS